VAEQAEKEYLQRNMGKENEPPVETMTIQLRRGECVLGYSGKRTYCGQEISFIGDENVSAVAPVGVSYPKEAVLECKGLQDKVNMLQAKRKRTTTTTSGEEPKEKTFLSDDDLPVCLTQLSELEDKYPGISGA